MKSLGILMAAWIISSIVVGIRTRLLLQAKQTKAGVKTGSLSRSYYGMQLAHFGVAVFIIGVTMVNGYEDDKDVSMNIGDTVEVGGYTFRFDGVKSSRGPNYDAQIGTITVIHDGVETDKMHPEKRYYNVQQQVMTEAAIDTGIFGDRYVSLGEPLGTKGGWSVRVYSKPFVDWIWFGTFLMGIGGFLAISDRRYRITSRKKAKKSDSDGNTTTNANEGAEQPVVASTAVTEGKA